jgi:predicted Rossmann-fold nucleotide-binding protein
MASNGTAPSAEPTTVATPKQTKICVYCGASAGNKPEHVEAARALARAMAANNIALGKQPSHDPPPLPPQAPRSY